MATRMAPQDLAALSHSQATARSDQVAMTFEGRDTTYAEMDQRANRVANELRALAPAAGTRVAVLAKNTDYFFEILFGAAKARHVTVGVNWRLAPAEVAYIVNDARVAVLFVGAEFLPVVAQIRAQLHTITRVIALSGDHPSWDAYVPWRDCQTATDPRLAVAGDDVALQLYTSGTTGQPKGAQLTHQNLVAALVAARAWFPLTAADVGLLCLPQFHMSGALPGLIAFYAGARGHRAGGRPGRTPPPHPGRAGDAGVRRAGGPPYPAADAGL
jgi:acyl-CoA synthetase (AMP-forming)/AMP-acid ligase II